MREREREILSVNVVTQGDQRDETENTLQPKGVTV